MKLIALVTSLQLALCLSSAQAARISGKPKGAGSVTVAPKATGGNKATAATPAAFRLERRNGKLELVFSSKDPKLTLNPKGGLVVQLNTYAPIELTPSVITGSEWPKSGDRLELKISGAVPGKPVVIEGKASYRICNADTKKCRRMLAPVTATFTP